MYRAVRAAVPRDGGTAWLRPPYELLHALPQEFWVDDLDATDNPTGWTGERIESHVHLVTCPAATLHSMEEAVNGAGIHVERLVAAPLAVGHGVLTREERQEGVVLLDIGAMTTEIAVFRHGTLRHSDLMPSGGRAYTKDLALGLKTSHAHAEQAKRRYGVALVEKVPEDDYFEIQVSGGGYPKQWRRRLLADVLQRRAESDLTKIRDQLGRVLRDVPRTMVLTGGGANLDGLSDVARLVFGAYVESRGSPGHERPARSCDAPGLRLCPGPLPLRPHASPARARNQIPLPARGNGPRHRRRFAAGCRTLSESPTTVFPVPPPPQGVNP